MLVHYSLLFYLSPEGFADRADARKGQAFLAAFLPYLKALKDAGILSTLLRYWASRGARSSAYVRKRTSIDGASNRMAESLGAPFAAGVRKEVVATKRGSLITARGDMVDQRARARGLR